jgi:hypothetical protein
MTAVLFGSESGCWIVTTEGSEHRFDLDAMTVARYPGPGSAATVNDQTRPLLKIVQCQVGQRGCWLMKPEGEEAEVVEYYWHLSSRIRRIDPAPTGHVADPER